MLPEIEQLLILQDRDQKLRQLKAELATVPLEQKRLEQTAAQRSAHLEKLRHHTRELEVQRKKLELEVKSRQDSITKFRTQQFQTRKNEEFQALGQEIGRMEREIADIEDREIELMEDAEKAQAEARQAESEFKTGEDHNRQQTAALARKKELLEARIVELEVDRQRVVDSLDPDLVFQYSRIFVSKGGDAVVPIEHEVCVGCHMKNTPTIVHRAKLGREIVHCEQCGRIVY